MINIKISSWVINWDGFDDKWLDGIFFEGTFLSTGTNIKISFLFKAFVFKKTCSFLVNRYLGSGRET